MQQAKLVACVGGYHSRDRSRQWLARDVDPFMHPDLMFGHVNNRVPVRCQDRTWQPDASSSGGDLYGNIRRATAEIGPREQQFHCPAPAGGTESPDLAHKSARDIAWHRHYLTQAEAIRDRLPVLRTHGAESTRATQGAEKHFSGNPQAQVGVSTDFMGGSGAVEVKPPVLSDPPDTMTLRAVVGPSFSHADRENWAQSGRSACCPRRARAQPEGCLAGPAPRFHDRLHRSVWFGQVEPRIRHNLRRGPAPLCRVAVCLRTAVPRPDGQARCGLHRRLVTGSVYRSEGRRT